MKENRQTADRRRARLGASLTVLALGLAGGPALAAADAAGQPSAQVSEVVVTAGKREAALQDLPQAVTAVTGDQLEKLGVYSFRDLATSVPSLTFVPTSASTTKIVLRGISTGNNNDAASSGTGLYLDDVPMGSAYGPGGTEINLVDLERVEVLRGPQGTLYGAGSMGGTVRYLTRKPNLSAYGGDLEWEGTVVDGHTDAKGSDLTGVLNAPLVKDRLGLRIVAYDRNDEGWISNPRLKDRQVNGLHLWGGRAALRWQPSDAWSVTLMGLWQDTHLGGGNWMDVNPVTKAPIAGDLTQGAAVLASPAQVKSRIVNLVIEGDLGWATLTSSTSYANFKRYQTSDDTQVYPFSLGPLVVHGTLAASEVFFSEDRDYAEEIRLASKSAGPLSWVSGIFLQDYKLPANRTISTVGGPMVSLLDGTQVQHRKTYALFGEGSYDFTPQWSLSLGGRYARIDSDSFQDLRGALLGPGAQVNSGSDSTTYFTPKAELSYKPAPNRLFYALYSEGYRPGGVNIHYAGVAVPASYAADTVKNFELGAKTGWFDQRLLVNLAVYDEQFDKLQVVSAVAGLPIFANVGSARSRGAELEVTARPARGLTLQTAASYTDAEFTSDAPALSAFRGDQIPQIPLWSASASADYVWPVRSGWDAFAHLDGRYVGGSPAGSNLPLRSLRLGDYSVLNARAGVTLGPAQVALFVENISDTRGQLGFLSITPQPSPPATVAAYLRQTVLRPRTVGVRLGYAF